MSAEKSTPSVYGLILSGGASRRMQTDKALLLHNGRTWLQLAFDKCQAVTEHTYVSIRDSQVNDAHRMSFPTIVDDGSEQGPIAGIRAAMRLHPHAAWLVLAVDLPALTTRTLTYLIDQRDPSKLATAFISQRDGQPEPLCAIYEPQSYAALTTFLNQDKHCPRRFLNTHDVKLMNQPHLGELENFNAPEDLAHLAHHHQVHP
jgi:molybdopterin-guanine dinucleotide biosynthesis protein A